MRYYYKNEKGNYFSYLSEHEDLIPITKEEFEEHISSKKRKLIRPSSSTNKLKKF